MNRLENAQASPPVNIEPDCSANIALLSDVVERITDGPLTAGNAVTILEGGDGAYPAMLAAIAGARAARSPWPPTSFATMRRGGNSPTP